MRVKIKFSGTQQNIPIHNQHLVNSYIHNCIGRNNEYHDKHSNYAISHLYGGKLNEDKLTLNFSNGGYIIASSNDNEFLLKLIMGLHKNINELGFGLKFAGIEHISEVFNHEWNHFATLSPILLKENNEFITLNNPDFGETLTKRMKNKLSKINPSLSLNDFEIRVPNNSKHKVKKILVKNVINHASQCQISVKCNSEVAELLFNIGVGQSCGSGFGTIYKTENHKLYR